jgi:hypothetical protein
LRNSVEVREKEKRGNIIRKRKREQSDKVREKSEKIKTETV